MASGERAEYAVLFRVMIVGDKRVGKTSLVNRFVDSVFLEDRQPHIEREKRSKIIEVKGKNVKLQVIDTVSREWHHSVDTIDFRRADAVFICYDVASLTSFHDTRYWPNRMGGTEDFKLALVGTKSDKKSTRVVTDEMGTAFAQELGAQYYITSAKTSSMVNELFQETALRLLNRGSKLRSDTWDTITLEESPRFSLIEDIPEPKKRCC